MESPPILYSFRRCPYAMRARFAILLSDKQVYIREILLRDKPAIMLRLSPKGTVPVLVFENGIIFDESIDIIGWAMNQAVTLSGNYLITYNDNEFKQHLDHYKYASRFPQHPIEYYRSQGEVFLKQLNDKLSNSQFLNGNELSITDIAIFPFIRQFVYVDKNWFDQSEYSFLQNWLYDIILSHDFIAIMNKYSQWVENDPPIIFPIRN